MPLPHDRRRAPREKVFEVSILVAGGLAHRAHLLDTSADGARAHCVHRFRVGQLVTLRAPDGERAAKVCWAEDDGKLGLRFVRL